MLWICLTEFNDCIRSAASCGELMAAAYSLLFDNGNMSDRKLSPQELYDYAAQYIDENYSQPLSMQSVCDEIGISTETILVGPQIDGMSDEELNEAVERCNVFVRLTPDNKMRIVKALRNNGHTVGLMGDGINDVLAMKAADVFRAATQSGAEAFGIDAGVIEAGKLADCILVDLNNHNLVPGFNLISDMVYAADSSCIDTVICDGRVLMRGGHVDGEEEIVAGAREAAKRLTGR